MIWTPWECNGIIVVHFDAWCNMMNTWAFRMTSKYPSRPIGIQIGTFHMDVGSWAEMHVEAHPYTQTLQPMLDPLPQLFCRLNDVSLPVCFDHHRPIAFYILHIRSYTLDSSDSIGCENHVNISSSYTLELAICTLDKWDTLDKWGSPFRQWEFERMKERKMEITLTTVPVVLLLILFVSSLVVGIMTIVFCANWQQSVIYQDTLIGAAVLMLGLTILSSGIVIWRMTT